MKTSHTTIWIDVMRSTVSSYRSMIDATIDQLTDAELFTRPAPGINSVAVILRHLGGNLESRWTEFMTTDGEKPSRNRDSEFLDWDGDWKWLTIAPGMSAKHNEKNWGTEASRSIFADNDDAR